jgi:hypothetical protein
MFDMILVEQGVVDRQDRAARVAENRFDSLIPQRPDDHLSAGHQIGHVLLQRMRFSEIVFGFLDLGNKKGP